MICKCGLQYSVELFKKNSTNICKKCDAAQSRIRHQKNRDRYWPDGRVSKLKTNIV